MYNGIGYKMMKNYYRMIRKHFVMIVLLVGLLWVMPVFAKECGGVETSLIECSEGGDGGIWHIINLVVDILSIGIGIVGVVGISIVGIQYLTAGPNAGQVQKAKSRMYQIVIGLAVYVIMFVGLQWLLPGGTFRQAVGIESFNVDKQSISVEAGKSKAIKTVFVPADASNKTVTWRSSDSNVATVSSNGVVTGRNTGTATITAVASDGKKASVDVTVSPSSNSSGSRGSGGSGGSSSNSGSSTSGKTNEEIRNELSSVAKKFANKKNRSVYQTALKLTGVYNSGTGGICRKLGKSCSAYVATVVRSVIRDSTGNKWPANTAKIPGYVEKVNSKHPGTWKVISASAKKEPGDIAYMYNVFRGNGHVAIFVKNKEGKTVLAEASVDTSYNITGKCDNGSWPHVTGYTKGPLYQWSHVTYYRYMGGS